MDETPSYLPELVADLDLDATLEEDARQFKTALHVIRKSKLVNLKPLLPLLFNLYGQPYSIDRYFPFEPMFDTHLPQKQLLKTARQVAKTTNLASQGILLCNTIPYFSILYITPLFEMIRRFSQNYVRPFIEESPVRGLFMGGAMSGNVLQRTFRNRSSMFFSYAFRDCNRTRGISVHANSYDEIQDLDKTFIPVIRETMSGRANVGLENYAGTPKSFENTIQGLWNNSSQAEWAMKCLKCGYWNIPTITHDLDRMFGPVRDNISMNSPGCVCARCQKTESIFPQLGYWLHAHPERQQSFSGLHIPQLIMPLHYADPRKWATMISKRSGAGNTSIGVFYNEVCGESYDHGSRLITMSELQAAATLGPNTVEHALSVLDKYEYRVLATDWGGGGEEGLSLTVFAVLGVTFDGQVEVIWARRSLTPHDHVREANLTLMILQKFKCHVLAHDYTGAGSLRETIVNQSGWPLDRIINIAYCRAAAAAKVMTYKPPTKMRPRPYWEVDKARSLLLTCNQIKQRKLRFFNWDYENDENPGLIMDFMALVDEKIDALQGREIYTVTKDDNRMDDFAQAVNIGSCALWHMTNKWPNLAAVNHARIHPAIMQAVEPWNANDQLLGTL